MSDTMQHVDVPPCRPKNPAMRHHLSLLPLCLLALPASAQVNDLCSSVTPDALAVGTSLVWTGDNTGATYTGDFVPGSSLDVFQNPAVWHAFTTTECADITVDYCGTTPPFGEFWNILATTCPAGNAYIPSQQTNTTACGDGNPTSYFVNIPAGTYYYPVWTETGVAEGPYTINVTASTCGGGTAVNDDCASITAEALVAGGSLTLSGDVTFATSTGDFGPGSPYAGAPVVWHAFTTTECADVALSYCGLDPAWTNSFGFLSRDCPASDIVLFSSFNTIDCVDGNRTYIFNQLAAGTYYVPVLLDPNDNAVGPYSLVLSAIACSGAPTYSDFCSQVQSQSLAIGASLTLSGDNTWATGTNDFDAGSPYAGAPVVWHAFTTTECAKVTLSYCGLDPVWTNSFGFLSRDCPASDLVLFSTFNTTDCVDGNRTYVFNQLAAGTYYVPVLLDPDDNAVGPYSLLLSAAACPTTPTYSDFCSQVQYQPLAVGGSLTLSGDNTAATGTNDFDPGSPFNGAPVMWHGITTTACMNITVAYCGLDPVWGNTFGFFSTACPMVTPYYFTTFNDVDCVDGNRTYIFNSVPPGDYLIPVVLDAANNAIGPYSLQVSSTACPTTPPANDNCANVIAENLAVGTSITLTGDNTNATSTGDFVPGSPFIAAPVTWHAFTTSECSDVLLRYCGQDPAWSNTFGFLATSCPGDALVYFTTTNTADCVDGNTTYLFNDLPAGTYFVPVLRDAANNSFGPYTVEVVAENCLFLASDVRTQTPLAIWPNPSNGHIYVDHVPAPGMNVQVMDATGRIVHVQRTGTAIGGRTELALEGHLAPGTYLLVITSAQHRLEQRFVVR